MSQKIIPKIVLLALLLSGTLLFYKLVLAKQQPPQEYKKYTSEHLSFTFEYPRDWIIKEESNSTSSFIRITIKNSDGFTLSFQSEIVSNLPPCKPYIPCDRGEPHIFYPLQNSQDFEYVGNVDNKKIYIAKNGGEKLDFIKNSSGTVISPKLNQDSANFVLEEKEGNFTQEMTIFGHEKKLDYLWISYGFDNDQAISKWPSYKEILKHIITSMKSPI